MEKTEHTRKSWDLALWFAIAVIFIIWIIIRGCSPLASSPTANEEPAVPDLSKVASIAPVSIKVKLPGGAELDAYKGGIEDKLVAYLNSTDPADSIDKNRWFDFDDLNFKTGSAEITEASTKQVRNIVAILKAYPGLSLKIGGYTDKTGREEDNMKLSQQRAEAVQNALKTAGAVNVQLAGAEGYGSQFARAAASAPDEERRPDRRISVSVRSK